jgi:RNA polymerase sigma-54 factor
MNQSLNLHQKAVQTLAVTPQMIQTLKIVQFSTPELLEYIQHEAAENPFLNEEVSNVSLNTEYETIQDEKIHNVEFDDEIVSSLRQTKKDPSETVSTSTVIERTASKEKHLSDILLEQLAFVYRHNSKEYEIGEIIIGSLDKDGYLTEQTLDEIKKAYDFDKEMFTEVLDAIKEFDPPGIASANIQECLLSQLSMYSDVQHQLALEIIKNYYKLLIKKKFNEIAKLTNESKAAVENAVSLIQLLELKPARKYSDIENNYITPDVFVRRNENDFQVIINNETLPKITFNNEYKNLKQVKGNKELKTYLKQKEEDALNLLNSIKYRQSNLHKVTAKLIEIQKDFFFDGPVGLKPFTLVKLSEILNINQGTLSRIVNSKYVDTEWGVFSLRIFFSSSVTSTKGDVSSNSIKEMIKEILNEYKGEKKLSDQKIVEYLAKKGIKIARRTLAKYRKELNILSSFHR